MDSFYHESMELRVRELLQIAKSQMEYNNLHKDYRDVKSELINSVLHLINITSSCTTNK